MKILITNPPWITEESIGFRSNVRWPFTIPLRDYHHHKESSFHFPLYQAYAAALLRSRGYDCDVIDAAVDALDLTDYLNKTAEINADVIILETATPSFDHDVETIRALDENLDAKIFLIGPHASVYHKKLLQENPEISGIIRGEYEMTILDIVKRLEEGGSLDAVEGLSLRRNGDVRINPDREPLNDLDSLPFPARELYPWERYHEPIYEKLPWITMITSRGCPYRCTFCAWPQVMYGRKFRARSPENIADEIEHCLEKHKPGEIFFDDDTFTIGKSRVKKICDEMIKREFNIIWSCMGRVDTVDKEILELMAEAGCRRIKFGVETGSEKLMQKIKKGIKLKDVPPVFKYAKEAGLKVHGTFMIGLPGETRETAMQTLDLASELCMDTAQFSIATPFPGTEFWKEAEKNGWFVTKDWKNFDGNFGSVLSYPDLSKKEIESLIEEVKMKFYERHGGHPLLPPRTLAKAPFVWKELKDHIRMGENEKGLLCGWYNYEPIEEGFRWTAKKAVVFIKRPQNGSNLNLELNTFFEDSTQQALIKVNGKIESKVTLMPGWRFYEVPLNGINDEFLEIVLEAEKTVPKEKMKADDRTLGIMVRSIGGKNA